MSTTTVPPSASLAEWLSSWPDAPRNRWLADFDEDEAAELEHHWPFWARPAQLPPAGDWRAWLILAGRGFGKTRAGAEWVRAAVERMPLVNLIGATADDARDILIEGESGLLRIGPPDRRPAYVPSKRRLEWPNGAVSLIFTADEPDRLRGKQHMALWADELASWRYPQEAWDQAMLGLRLGPDPRAVVTTTPKPVQLLKDLLASPSTAVTGGSTYENAANLAPAFLEKIIARYEGTRLGRQELLAELLEDVPGALWNRAQLDRLRRKAEPELLRVVVAIDPAMTSGEDADETGIVVAGLAGCACLGEPGWHGFVLEDRTCRATPDSWARRAIAAYDDRKADRVVAEVNNGGELVAHTLRTVRPALPYKAVHASRGKRVRAEPIAALYEQGKVHHVGAFPALEDQMVTFVPDDYAGSPDRVDALVWALTELMLGPRPWGGHA